MHPYKVKSMPWPSSHGGLYIYATALADQTEGHSSQLVQPLGGRARLELGYIQEAFMELVGEVPINRFQNGYMITQRNEPGGLDPHPSDAVVVREALEQGDTNYKVLVEIFVWRKSSQILLMKQDYGARFRRQMDQDIINIEPPHPYQKILVAFMASHKAHHADVSQHIAKCDARRLYEAGVGKSGGTEEAVVLEILSKRSIPQLKLTFSCYKHIYGHDYTKLLKKENSGEFEDAFKSVVKCMCSPAKYYAKTLHSSIKGSATDKGALAWVMASRAGVDVDEIVRVFRKKYGMELREAIYGSIPSGDLRD